MDTSRVPCDFQGCPTTFTRQQDQSRHKREVHGEPKKCPWCDYTTRRDGRLLDHIDENHRPRKHKSRSSIDYASHPAPTQGEGSRVKDRGPSQALDDMPIQGQATFRQSVSGAALLQPQNKRATYQKASSHPILPTQLSASPLFQDRSQMAYEMDSVDDSRANRGLPMRLRPSVGSENFPGMQVVNTSRDGLVKSEQSSSKKTPATNYSPSMINGMPTTRHGPFSQGVQPHLLHAFQSSQPVVHFKPTPLSSSPYATQLPFHEFPMHGNPASPQTFASSQDTPSFGSLMPPASSPNPSYSPMSTHMSPQTNSPSYPQSFNTKPNRPSDTTQFRQEESLVFLTDEEYAEYNKQARSTGWQ